MNKLEEIIKSCEDFKSEVKNGETLWQEESHDYFSFVFKIDTNLGRIKLFLDSKFFYTFCDKSIHLKSTTAKEAAHEALQLVKKEAQKLVDALEPKEPFWIPIDYNNLPRMKVIVKTGYGDYIEGIIGTDSGNGLDYILCCNTKKRYYTTFTHYHDISKYPLPQ